MWWEISAMIPATLTNIFKLFLPSWNFFDGFSTVPRLDVRLIREAGGADWRPLYAEHSTRSIVRIFFNARGNLELLEKDFIERATDALEGPGAQSSQEFAASEVCAVLVRIVRSRLTTSQPGDGFQFRLAMAGAGQPEKILFVSGRYSTREESF